MKKTFTLIMASMLAFSFSAHAEKVLTGDEVKVLFSGKKFKGKNHDTGKDSTNTAKADGWMNANVLMGPNWSIKWWVNEEGLHCLKHPKFGESCGTIIDNGDGSYTRMVDGKKANTYKRFK